MQSLISIELNDLHFTGAHGYYDIEHTAGNEFIIDLRLSYVYDKEVIINSLSDTIDYAAVYAIIYTQVKQRKRLLETLAQECIAAIKNSFPQCREIEIAISKKYVPIPGFSGRMAIRVKETFNP